MQTTDLSEKELLVEQKKIFEGKLDIVNKQLANLGNSVIEEGRFE